MQDLCRWQSGNFHARRQTQQLVNTLKTFPSCYCNIDRGKHLGAGFCSQDYNRAADSMSPWPQLVAFVIWSPGDEVIWGWSKFLSLLSSHPFLLGIWQSCNLAKAQIPFSTCPNSVLGDLQKRQRNPLGSVEPQSAEGTPVLEMSCWIGCTSPLLLAC